MTRKPATEAEPEQTSLAIFEVQNPVAVLTDSAKFESFYERIRAETEAHVPDLTTESGRKAIASLAFRVTKTKTAIDAEGKRLTEEWRANVTKVDASRKVIRDRLDALRDKVRAPLTAWETNEEQRVAEVEGILAAIRAASVIDYAETADDVEERIKVLRSTEIVESHFQAYYEIGVKARDHVIGVLTIGVARLRREEAERVELMRLRAEQEARIEADRLKRDAEEAAAAELVRAETERVAAQLARERQQRAEEERKAEIERVAQAEREAAEARAVAEALRVQQETERRHNEALAAEKRRADEAEAAQRREADRVAREKAAVEAETKRLADEQAARDKDRKHRGEVMAAAKDALMLVGVSEATAKSIVRAIVAEEIPNVRLTF